MINKEEIIQAYKEGLTQRDISNKFGVSQAYISQVISKYKLNISDNGYISNISYNDLVKDIDTLKQSVADLSQSIDKHKEITINSLKQLNLRLDNIVIELQEKAEIQLKKAMSYHVDNYLRETIRQEIQEKLNTIEELNTPS